MKIVGRVSPLLIYCLASLSTFAETIYSAALPDIAENLKTYGGIAQFSTTAYYFGFATGIFTLGRISDLIGRKPVVIFGLSFSVVICLIISYAPNIEIFIVLRFLQAYGASVGSVIGQAITRDSYKGWELSYVYASIAMLMTVVPSIGSIIGGYIVEYSNWRNVFRFLSVLISILLLIYIKYLPETNAYIGARNTKFITVFKVTISDKILLSYAFIVGAFNGICFGFYIQAPFIFIDNLQMSPSNYGKLFLFLSGTNLLGGLASRKLIKNFVSSSRLKVIGFIFSIIGCALLIMSSLIINEIHLATDIIILLIFVPIAIHLIGHSLVVPMLLRHALEDYYKVKGSAGAIFGSLYYLMTAIIISIISWLHSNNINNFTILFTILLSICLVLFYLTKKWKN